jgi:hypothetical protein
MTHTRLRSQPRFIASFASVPLAAGLWGAAGAHAARKVNVRDMGELSPGLGSEAEAISNAPVPAGGLGRAQAAGVRQLLLGLPAHDPGHEPAR